MARTPTTVRTGTKPHSPMQADRTFGLPPTALALLPLRAFLGFTFAFAGLQKLANPDYLRASSPTSVQSTILALRHQSPIGPLLSLSSHAPVLVGILIALGELSVGLATLTGLWVRLASVGGLVLSLTFFLTVSWHTTPYYYGSDIVFVFAWTVPLLLGSWGGSWTLDGWVRARAARDVDPQRRALVLGGSAAAALAGVTGVLAALTAVVGRARHQPAPTATPQRRDRGPQPQPQPSGSPSHRHRSLPGRHVAAAADVPTGQALRFTDDNGQPAYLVHESDGSFRAFSAVCTHAGCIVGLSGGRFVCPCHGGVYDARNGAVLGGPPPSPLPALNVRVVNGDVRLL